MRRIKMIAYINPDDLDPEDVDLGHSTGLTNSGFNRLMEKYDEELSEVEFQLEREK